MLTHTPALKEGTLGTGCRTSLWREVGMILVDRRPPALSDASGSTETDRHLAVLDDHRHLSDPLAELEHSVEFERIRFDVEETKLDASLGEVLTGRRRVRSGGFSENESDF